MASSSDQTREWHVMSYNMETRGLRSHTKRRQLLDTRSDAKTRSKSQVTSESNECEVNRKDSFDRFGDDLCQHLLSYLALEDRFRAECVSRQWQRFVFTTHKDMIFDTSLRRRSYEVILNACQHVTRIEFPDQWPYINHLILDSVIVNCNHLNALHMRSHTDISVQTMDTFLA
ncbi:unnamed protein product, partial [Oppiella nova]